MRQFIRKLRRDQKGVTALEYGLIAALISLAIVAVVTKMGADLNTVFTTINTSLTTAIKG